MCIVCWNNRRMLEVRISRPYCVPDKFWPTSVSNPPSGVHTVAKPCDQMNERGKLQHIISQQRQEQRVKWCPQRDSPGEHCVNDCYIVRDAGRARIGSSCNQEHPVPAERCTHHAQAWLKDQQLLLTEDCSGGKPNIHKSQASAPS